MTGRKPGGPGLTEEDREVWRRVAESCDARVEPAEAVLPDPPSPARRISRAPSALPPPASAQASLPGLEPGAGDPRWFRSVRKTPRAVEATLDLHGHTELAAYAALSRFLQRCQAERLRMVRIVTGKGKQGEGLLRRRVLEWLNLPEWRPLVVACAYAPPRQGGEGALDVMLRRRAGR